MAVFALHTKEANEEAKKLMNPIHSKSTWVSAISNNDITYGQGLLDASASIYNMTLK